MADPLPPSEPAQSPPGNADVSGAPDQAAAARIAELEAGAAQLRDQLLRKAAEFENYKRRVEGDYGNVVRFSNENLITRLLPVLDDFERFLKASREGSGSASASESAFHRGMELIQQKLVKLLETQGVQPFESVGKPFDPELHDAVMQLPSASVPPQTVLEEVEKGYRLHDKVIRHAKVVVSAEEEEEESPSIEDIGVGD